MIRRAEIAARIEVQRSGAYAVARLPVGPTGFVAIASTFTDDENPADMLLGWLFSPLAGDLVRLLPRRDELAVRAFAARAERLSRSMEAGEYWTTMDAGKTAALTEAADLLQRATAILQSVDGQAALRWVIDADFSESAGQQRLAYGWKRELPRLATAAAAELQAGAERHRRPPHRSADHGRQHLERELRAAWSAIFGRPPSRSKTGDFAEALALILTMRA